MCVRVFHQALDLRQNLWSGIIRRLLRYPPNRGGVRSHLTAYLSDDDGASWYGGLLLDERVRVSYPDGVQTPDGKIYIIYDYDRQGERQICMAVFTEADVAAGKIVSSEGRLRVLVDQATYEG